MLADAAVRRQMDRLLGRGRAPAGASGGASPLPPPLTALARARSVVVIAGAGLSVAAGIPDFRTPGTGLYSRLSELSLPYPEAVFELRFFARRPEPFFRLARSLWPGRFAPTRAHHFLALLARRGVLRRLYTQNIDTLERAAGVPPQLLVEAHGSFASATCRQCGAGYDQRWLAAALGLPPPDPPGSGAAGGGGHPPPGAGDDDAADDAVVIPRCARPACGGVVKPDIVFFGEDLPDAFHDNWRADMAAADCVLVLGTSLQVHPVAGLPGAARKGVPRIALNREPLWGRGSGYDHARHAVRVGPGVEPGAAPRGGSGGGGAPPLRSPLGAFHPATDVMLHGDCDDGATALARACGWEGELLALEAAWHAAHGRSGGRGRGGEGGGRGRGDEGREGEGARSTPEWAPAAEAPPDAADSSDVRGGEPDAGSDDDGLAAALGGLTLTGAPGSGNTAAPDGGGGSGSADRCAPTAPREPEA